VCSLRFVTDGTLPQTLTSLRVRQLRELPACADCVKHVTQLQQLRKLELSGSAKSFSIGREVRRLFSLPCALLPRLAHLHW